MAELGAKQIMYIYPGDNDFPDLEYDENGEIPEPEVGSVIWRGGKRWTVTGATVLSESFGPRRMPVLKVNLADRN